MEEQKSKRRILGGGDLKTWLYVLIKEIMKLVWCFFFSFK